MYQSKESKKNLDNAKNDLQSAKENAKSAIRSGLDEVSAEAETKVRDLRATARDAGERVSHFLHERRDDMQHARESAERTIRNNPLAAGAVLLAAGALLGSLLSSRR